MAIERKKIKLTSRQLWELVFESQYWDDDSGEYIEFDEQYHEIEGNTRHTQIEYKIFKNEQGEFYRADYETSVKDSMGWDDCNPNDEYEIYQVFPRTVEVVVYD